MPTKYDFDVLESYDHGEFIEQVSGYLLKGWEFHGVMIAFPHFIDNGEVQSVKYIQAFIKKIPSSGKAV